MKILIASSIDPEAIATLEEHHDVICAFNAPEDQLKSLIADRDVLVFRSGVKITRDVMMGGPLLKLLLRAGSGLDNIDLDYVRDRELPLQRIPGPSARAVAELTFAHMLALTRQVLVGDRLLREGHWAKYELEGFLLQGKVLGIVGAGNIGSTVGQMGAAWGMDVVGCVEFLDEDSKQRLISMNIRPAYLEEVVATADYLSIHVPLKDDTHYLINRDILMAMKRGSFLINMARGGVVDEQALLEALAEGHLRGAALDVHEAEGENLISPLAHLSNVVLTPHIGAMAKDTQREIGLRVVEIIAKFEQNEAQLGHKTDVLNNVELGAENQ